MSLTNIIHFIRLYKFKYVPNKIMVKILFIILSLYNYIMIILYQSKIIIFHLDGVIKCQEHLKVGKTLTRIGVACCWHDATCHSCPLCRMFSSELWEMQYFTGNVSITNFFLTELQASAGYMSDNFGVH